MSTTNRFVCIHGHFYQPPRESPWLEAVPPEDTAYPYHDWNERITQECYGPNTAARILDGDGLIRDIVNNYALMSFNFGPTLLSWLESRANATYRKILEADRLSRDRFSGHGSAMAQAYNHLILPLANARDKKTQIRWGIKDFEHRFQRLPEGMWLPETAVDTDTLSALAAEGIRFTVLAPHQAHRIRQAGEEWRSDLPPGGIDTTRSYLAPLPDGKSIALFFYNGGLSRAVAFEHLLDNGETLVQRLLSAIPPAPDGPALSHIATDGETYGHHQPFGDMALAWALRAVERDDGARLTNYAEFLERCPPRLEVQIQDRTSWSCAHGVSRWEDDCGCSTGGQPGWNQRWRRPLRDALDLVRDLIADPFAQLAGAYLHDPWEARDDYISVILDRSPQNVRHFIERHGRPGAVDAVPTILKLMELQRNALLMYTSCAFFFDDISRIETVQIMKYVARVCQLAEDLFHLDVEGPFLERLRDARSNLRSKGDGASIYLRGVKPSTVGLSTVAGHYAVASLFEEHPHQIYCYRAERPDFHLERSGAVQFAVGNLRITSEITRETGGFTYAALHFGDHHVSAGVRPWSGSGDDTLRQILEQTREALARADLMEVTRVLGSHFPDVTTSLRDLFRDEQRRILTRIVDSAVTNAHASYRQVYRRHISLMRFLSDIDMPLPVAFAAGVRVVVHQAILGVLATRSPDPERLEPLFDEAIRLHVAVDDRGIALAFQEAVEHLAEGLGARPELGDLKRLARLVSLAGRLETPLALWKTQNAIWAAKGRLMSPAQMQLPGWRDALQNLGTELGLRMEG